MFFLLNVLPGDAALLAGASRKGQSEETIANLRAKWGLDDPIHVRYFKYMFNLFKGDLGTSYRTHTAVSSLLANKLVATFTLVGLAALGSTVLGVLLGFIAGMRHGSITDLSSMGFAILGISAPRFWVGLMLMYLFAVILG
ncbi:ABC transporter permease, partial [Candidatus Bipolaricaulota bacterium]|nr:ABC transporter permease [Candidatus Bipolaricaulota bacterium]